MRVNLKKAIDEATRREAGKRQINRADAGEVIARFLDVLAEVYLVEPKATLRALEGALIRRMRKLLRK